MQVAGTVSAPGAPLAVMDIGAAQDLLGRCGQLTRIDLQLQPGTDRSAFRQSLQALPGWPAQATLAEPGDAAQRVSNLSRAYRVNLTVLALVALFTGAFLVFSVLALSVAQRGPQFALLAVLGATPRQRLALVLAESALLGVAGSLAGLALGTALASAALQLLGGDLGGGYFAGVQPRLQWSLSAALLYGSLGVAAAVAGGWWPARAAQALPPAQTLKGLGSASGRAGRGWVGMVLIAASAVLAALPPIFGIPLAAYVAIGLLLVGGIALLPWGVAWLLQRLQPLAVRHPLTLLALERARRMRGTAAIAVGGVGGQPEPGRGADGDGGQLSRLGHPVAGRGAALAAVRALGPTSCGRRRRPAAPRLCRSGGPPAGCGQAIAPAHQPPATRAPPGPPSPC